MALDGAAYGESQVKRNMDGRLRNKLWVPPLFRESKKLEKERAVKEEELKRKQYNSTLLSSISGHMYIAVTM